MSPCSMLATKLEKQNEKGERSSMTEGVGHHENSPKLREHRTNIRDVPASEGVPQFETLHGRQLTQSAEPHVRGEP